MCGMRFGGLGRLGVGRERTGEDLAIGVVAAIGAVEAVAGLVAGNPGLAVVGAADVVLCTVAHRVTRE